MSNYENMPREELIAELKAWEGKLEAAIDKKYKVRYKKVIEPLEKKLELEFNEISNSYYDEELIEKLKSLLTQEEEDELKYKFFNFGLFTSPSEKIRVKKMRELANELLLAITR